MPSTMTQCHMSRGAVKECIILLLLHVWHHVGNRHIAMQDRSGAAPTSPRTAMGPSGTTASNVASSSLHAVCPIISSSTG